MKLLRMTKQAQARHVAAVCVCGVLARERTGQRNN